MQLGENQKKFVTALRTTKMLQSFSSLFANANGVYVNRNVATHCCALGVGSLEFTSLFNELAFSTSGACRVIDMNDEEKLTFIQIADKIEASPAKFFTESK